jgi:hypothetical protein
MMASSIVAVHGIWNLQRGLSPQEAAEGLGRSAAARLASGMKAANLDQQPEVTMAYYADLLDEGASEVQGVDEALDTLNDGEIALLRQWLELAGVRPPEQSQNPALWPIRQALGLLAARRSGSVDRLGRLMVACVREVSAYILQQERRRAAREGHHFPCSTTIRM